MNQWQLMTHTAQPPDSIANDDRFVYRRLQRTAKAPNIYAAADMGGLQAQSSTVRYEKALGFQDGPRESGWKYWRP